MRDLACRAWLAAALVVMATLAHGQRIAAGADHPLVGRIWDVDAARFVALTELEQRLAGSTFVLIGENHDNAEHHRVQLDLVAALVRHGRRPAIAMEQFDREHQAAIDAAREARPRDAAHLRSAAKFNERGWHWAFYEPIVDLALEYSLPLIAANLSRADALRVVSAGLGSLGADRLRELGLDQPLEDARHARLEAVIDAGHCGKTAAATLTGMAQAQRARDAVMAHSVAAHRGRGTVLIAGNGHVRRDFGVPHHLERLAAGARVTSVGLVEIRAGEPRADDYPEHRNSLFDYVWFTSGIPRDDPCLRFNSEPKK